MIVDIFTKFLPKEKHFQCLSQLGMYPIPLIPQQDNYSTIIQTLLVYSEQQEIPKPSYFDTSWNRR